MNTALIPQDVIHAVASIAGTTDIDAFSGVLARTIMPNANVQPEQITAFLMVAKEYKLNPITKEIYAFPSKGGVQPIVSIDGWLKIINSHPDFDGMEFVDSVDNGALIAVTCRIYRKDRQHPVEVTEYMAECKRNTDPWKQWPARMLRHKATIQAARYAFGFSGIVDPDEAERIASVQQPPKPAQAAVMANADQVRMINDLLTATQRDAAPMLAYFGADSVEALTADQAQAAIRKLQAIFAEQQGADENEEEIAV